MDAQMPRYEKIDMETWPRREHFNYYRKLIRCGYSLTNRVDVTTAVEFSEKNKLHFYPCMIYAIAKTVNSMPELRMMLTPEGEPGVWEMSNPNFTVFHKDDHTFSDLWCEYDPDFQTFYQNFEAVIREFGDNKGVKGRPGQPANFFCTSCVPWLDYTALATHSVGDPALFPIVDFGKYTRKDGRYTLPMTFTISHASADGYHACRFFETVQKNVELLGQ